MTPTYTRPGPPERGAIQALMDVAGWSRRDLAEVTHVAESTVDQWLAMPGARRVCAMPAGLYELAKIKASRLIVSAP